MKQEEINKLWDLRKDLLEIAKILEKYSGKVVFVEDVKRAIELYVRDGTKEELILKELGIIAKDNNLSEEKEK